MPRSAQISTGMTTWAAIIVVVLAFVGMTSGSPVPSFNRPGLTAAETTAVRHLTTLNSELDKLQASGKRLPYDQCANNTTDERPDFFTLLPEFGAEDIAVRSWAGGPVCGLKVQFTLSYSPEAASANNTTSPRICEAKLRVCGLLGEFYQLQHRLARQGGECNGCDWSQVTGDVHVGDRHIGYVGLTNCNDLDITQSVIANPFDLRLDVILRVESLRPPTTVDVSNWESNDTAPTAGHFLNLHASTDKGLIQVATAPRTFLTETMVRDLVATAASAKQRAPAASGSSSRKPRAASSSVCSLRTVQLTGVDFQKAVSLPGTLISPPTVPVNYCTGDCNPFVYPQPIRTSYEEIKADYLVATWDPILGGVNTISIGQATCTAQGLSGMSVVFKPLGHPVQSVSLKIRIAGCKCSF